MIDELKSKIFELQDANKSLAEDNLAKESRLSAYVQQYEQLKMTVISVNKSRDKENNGLESFIVQQDQWLNNRKMQKARQATGFSIIKQPILSSSQISNSLQARDFNQYSQKSQSRYDMKSVNKS